jgi:membrane protease YdiL (CAAX protease family)
MLLGLAALAEHFLPESDVDLQFPHWSATLLASVGAGISEEIINRLGVLTLFAWLGTRLLRRRAPGARVLWSANVSAALLFGALHLPQAALFGSLTGLMLAYVLVGNGAVGLVFGWLYWRYGLLAAMLCHATTDVAQKVVLPLLWG